MKHSSQSLLGILRSRNTLHALVVAIILSIHAYFGLPRLETYSAVDEPYWTYDRTPDFWRAVLDARWKSTDVNDKPGITVAIISGAGLLTIDPMPYAPLRDEPKTDEQLAAIKKINVAFRLPIYLFALLSLPLLYLLVRSAVGATTAILSTVFVGLSPILLGMSLIINPDSLLWIFLPFAILSRIAYGKTRKLKFLIFAGFATGLALLTKYVANILFVFFFAFPFLEYLFAEEKQSPAIFLKRTLRDLLIIIGVSLAIFTLLYPATWVKPEMILKGTILSAAFKSTWPIFAGAIAILTLDAVLIRGRATGAILSFLSRWKGIVSAFFLSLFLALVSFTLANTWLRMRWFNFESFVMSPKNSEDTATILKSVGSILSDFYCLVFGIHPLILAFLISALLLSIFRRLRHSQETLVLVSFSFFIMLYYIGSTANYVIATVRYQIALYPLACIMAAIGAASIAERIGVRQERPLVRNIALPIFFSAILIGSLVVIRPHYLAYSSSLLPETHVLNYKDMGDGSYEAAMYLNSLPNARELRVWSDKGAVCAMFVGDCSVSFNQKRFKAAVPDYLVLSTGRRRKTTNMWSSDSVPLDFKSAYETAPAEFSLLLDNRPNNFVKVVNADTVRRVVEK